MYERMYFHFSLMSNNNKNWFIGAAVFLIPFPLLKSDSCVLMKSCNTGNTDKLHSQLFWQLSFQASNRLDCITETHSNRLLTLTCCTLLSLSHKLSCCVAFSLYYVEPFHIFTHSILLSSSLNTTTFKKEDKNKHTYPCLWSVMFPLPSLLQERAGETLTELSLTADVWWSESR